MGPVTCRACHNRLQYMCVCVTSAGHEALTAAGDCNQQTMTAQAAEDLAWALDGLDFLIPAQFAHIVPVLVTFQWKATLAA